MPLSSVNVKASILRGFDNFLAERGVALEPLAREVGLDPATFNDEEALLPFAAVATLMERAAEMTHSPALGLEWAEAFPVGGTGTLGYLMLNSGSVRQAFMSLAGYVALLTHPIEIKFEEEAAAGVLSWRWPANVTTPYVQCASFLTALLIVRVRQASRGAWEPVMVELAHRPLGCDDIARRQLGSNIVYNSIRYAVHVDKSTLDMPFSLSGPADPRLHAIMKMLGDRMLADLSKAGGLEAEVRSAIFKSLDSGEITLEGVASRLNLSPRALQSRLSQAGTSYEALLNETRSNAAQRYLRDTELSLTEIALLLGFSELSAFTRAAQRWFGEAPSVVRQRLRSERA